MIIQPLLFALMALTDSSTPVSSSKSSVSDSTICDECAKYEKLKEKYDILIEHNHELAADLRSCNTANLALKANESKFIKTLETHQEDVVELSKTVVLRQAVINRYIDLLGGNQERACNCEMRV